MKKFVHTYGCVVGICLLLALFPSLLLLSQVMSSSTYHQPHILTAYHHAAKTAFGPAPLASTHAAGRTHIAGRSTAPVHSTRAHPHHYHRTRCYRRQWQRLSSAGVGSGAEDSLRSWGEWRKSRNDRGHRDVERLVARADLRYGGDDEHDDLLYSMPEVAHISEFLPDLKPEKSPIAQKPGFKDDVRERNEKVLVDISICKGELCEDNAKSFLRAGPREDLYFSPGEVRAGIVTCGGLCPGLNSVVRELTNSLWQNYDVRNITGFRYGLRGLRLDLSSSIESHKQQFVMPLNPDSVAGIHQQGGTILGTGRGAFDADAIMDTLDAFGINMLFIVGGDGTHGAADAIYEQARKDKKKLTVVAIPKTIDNDINIIDRSFGFETSIEEAQRAISSAKVEAKASINGVGIVRLMGRHSGAITLMASLASNDVDIALIPEVPFNEQRFLDHLVHVLDTKGHAVVVAAEGMADVVLKELQKKAALDVTQGGATQPISGDIGQHLKQRIKSHLASLKMDHRLINIDPTYMIRSIPANAGDKVYCAVLSQQAVHGAMAGFTGFSAGMVSTNYVYIPITEVIKAGPRKVDPHGQMWYRLITSTQQPASFGDPRDLASNDGSNDDNNKNKNNIGKLGDQVKASREEQLTSPARGQT